MVIETILLFGIPLILCTFLPFGWLRSRVGYFFIGGFFFLSELVLFIYATGMSQMYAGFGSYKPSPWDGWGPVISCMIFGICMMFIGFSLRRGRASKNREESVPLPKLKTLRQVESDQDAEQGSAHESTTAP